MPAMTALQLACRPIFAANSTGRLEGGAGGAVLGSDWLLLSVLALVASTLALAIVYMFASFLRNAQLLGWAKFELFQVFGTAAILVFFATTLYGACTFDMSFLDSRYSHADNMYSMIDEYFSKLQDIGYLLFGYVMYVTKVVAYMSRITAHSSPMGVGSSENPLESLGQLNSLVFVMLSGFVTSFLLLELQMRMLDYLAYACLGYLFPLGMFFRCFEPTRSFGGTLLGLSISFFLFFPIIMVFNDYLMFSQIQDLQSSVTAGLAGADSSVQSGKAPSPQNAGEKANSGLGGSSGGTPWYLAAWEAISHAVLFLFRPILVYVIAAVVLPVINFIVLVEIARGSTAFLGDELDVSNLTRLI